ncbi:hypothetical protein UFOVP211_40 [uncultured Caudovirales phage]|uniref:Uncharacterized protein n=1 Tax=uncultured Caudovirales phage TaxID=2100421 RepID=A0A6J7WPH9_9CAUD|nr:hypothetical protein UFOVP211_40 [uncultured Caudovirales phage]
MKHEIKWTPITSSLQPYYGDRILYTWFNPDYNNFGVSDCEVNNDWIERHEKNTGTIVIAWTEYPDPFGFMIPEGLETKEDVIKYMKAIGCN